MEIHDSHVEWAVVARLRDLLESSPSSEFEVTEAYALFTAIVCWIAQRMRATGQSPQDKAAQRFRSAMDRHSLSDIPGAPQDISMTTGDAIVAMRNACAHGDGRTVRPLHRRSAGRPPSLIGFEFEGRGAPLRLTSHEMVALGTWIADAFIEHLSAEQHRTSNLPHFREVVASIKEIRA